MELQSLLKVAMLVNQLSKIHQRPKMYSCKAESYGKCKYCISIYTDSIIFPEDCVALFQLFKERGLCAYIGTINDHPYIYAQ